MNARDLSRLAAMGEGLTLEFKRKVPRAARLAKEVIALANTAGGYVLIGVDDDGTVMGVRDSFEEQYALAEAVNSHISPAVELEIERVEVARRREALVVRVPLSIADRITWSKMPVSGQASRTCASTRCRWRPRLKP